MKQRTSAVVLIVLTATGFVVVASSRLALAKDVRVPVYVDGKLAQWEEQAIVRDGKTYAPLRAAAEALGAHVTWQPRAQLAVVCKGDRCVPIAKRDGIIVGGRLYIPLRVMAEALNCKVAWDAKARAVRIETSQSLPGAGGRP